ncbi:hypothetical protein [Rhizobium sp. CSW-27]|uniref:hypothetical protein n=1 Tax=Rhizobium sp. CSW-27 TaxID=2839985 RepID=UPI001C01CEBB|nr:hypothetical protein [Rhizobium sp. CSW-27]MBT9368285.1 hypothetical protein [Rhizobium sp. CSW-27]
MRRIRKGHARPLPAAPAHRPPLVLRATDIILLMLALGMAGFLLVHVLTPPGMVQP